MRQILFIIGLIAGVLAATAGNVVSLTSAQGRPGEEVTVAVSMTGTAAVSALQLQVPLPDVLTVVPGSEQLGARATDHRATVGVKDGVLNVMVWSLDFTPFAGTEGEVVSFRLRLGNEPTTAALEVSRLVLTDAQGEPLEGTATCGTVTIATPKVQLASRDIDYGHIPIRDTYHRSLVVTNVGNALLTVRGIEPSAAEFSSETAFPLVVEAGATGEVDVTYKPTERGAIVEDVRLLSDKSPAPTPSG
ncbi:MAG: DUF1573 domain-containing protein [Muribaculaceae bacterium]|nr:DUF1573 domain-containing protein [Muribaculaceae bacterium]